MHTRVEATHLIGGTHNGQSEGGKSLALPFAFRAALEAGRILVTQGSGTRDGPAAEFIDVVNSCQYVQPTFRRSSNQYLRDFRVGQVGGSMAVFSG